MKRKLIIILMILVGIPATSQNLTLSQILSIRKKNISEAEEYLTQRNWSMIKAEAPTSDTFGELTFAYKKSEYNDKATSFISFLYSDNEGNRITIQINKKEKYNEYISQIKKWGGKIYDSFVKEKVFRKIYQDSTMTYSTMTYIVQSSAKKDNFSSSKTIYGISIMTNEAFKYFPFYKKEKR